jgi:hypothetical protein
MPTDISARNVRERRIELVTSSASDHVLRYRVVGLDARRGSLDITGQSREASGLGGLAMIQL